MIFPSVLRSKNFVFLWISQAGSVIGLCIVNYILILKLFHQTNSTLAVSFLWISYSLPVFLVGPFAATVVDLFDRKKLLAITNLLQALIILTLLLIKQRLFLIYGVVFGYSFLNQFYLPAESASLPMVVPKDQLAEANGFFLLSKEAGLLVGFGLATILFKLFSTENSLIFCSFFLLIPFFSVLFLPKLKTHQRPVNLEKGLVNFFSEVIDGYNYIKNNKGILSPILLMAGESIIYTIIMINVPALINEVFRIALDDAALLIVIPATLGAITSAFASPRLLGRFFRKKSLIEFSLSVLCLNLFFLVFIMASLPLSFRLLLIPLISFTTGASFLGINIPCQTHLQQVTPAGMMGRLFGNFWFIINLVTIIPLIFSATITEIVGVRFLLSILAVGTLFVILYIRQFGEDFIRSQNHQKIASQ